MRREGLEPSRPKAVTGSLVLRVCQFRHPRVHYFTSISTFTNFVNTFFIIFFTGAIAAYLGFVNEKKAGGSILPSWIIHALANILSGLVAAFSLF